jgi:hypothetical protein
MNYIDHYHKLIEKAQAENCPIDKRDYHRHHIIPKSLGGTEDNDNFVWLTHRQHFCAHLLLSAVWPSQIFACELIALRTKVRLKKWQRRRAAFLRAGLYREHMRERANAMR